MAVHIHRLKRTDKPSEHLLLHISQSGPKPLDLKLIATDHEHLYHADILESQLKSLQAPNYPDTLEDWKTTLKSALLHSKPPDNATPLQALETVAAIKAKTLTLTLRKNVEGITQRLGTIHLEQDDEREEVSPFSWVDVAVSSGDALRAELEALQISVSAQREEVARLTRQLDELVQAKKENEGELVGKFVRVLNEKKLKIRDLLRLVGVAGVDGGVAGQVGSARRKGGGSAGRGKRKAEEVEVEGEEQEQDDAAAADGEGEEASEYDEVQQETPPRTDDDDETEDEDDLDAPATANGGGSGGGKGRADEAVANEGEMEVDDEPPPRRELPAAMRVSQSTRQAKATAAAAAEVDGEDDETDDEL